MKKGVLVFIIIIAVLSFVYYGSEKIIKTFSDDEKDADGYAVTKEYKINVSYDDNLDENLHEKIKEIFEQYPYDVINQFCSTNWSIKISKNIEKEVDIENRIIFVDNSGTNDEIIYRLKISLCHYADYYYNNASSSLEFKQIYEKYGNQDEKSNDYFARKMQEYIEDEEKVENIEPEIYKYFKDLEKKE